MEIGLAQMRIRYPLRMELSGLRVGTMLSIGHMEADIRLRPLIDRTLRVDVVTARDISIHTSARDTTTFLAEHLRADDIAYQWDEREISIRRILLADSDMKLSGSTPPQPKDSSPNGLPFSLSIADIQIHHIGASYSNAQVSLQSEASHIAIHDIAVDTAIRASLQNARIEDGTLTLERAGSMPWQLTRLHLQTDSLRYSSSSITGKLTHLTFKESHGIDLQEGALAFAWDNGTLSLPSFVLRTGHSTLQGHLHTLSYGTADTTLYGDAHLSLGYADAYLLARRIGGPAQELSSLYPTETLSASLALNGTMRHLRLTRCAISLPTAFDISLSGAVHDIATPQQCVARCHVEARTYDLDFLTALADSTSRSHIRIPRDMTLRGNISYAPDTLHARCSLAIDTGTATLEAGYRPTSKAYELLVETDSLDLQQFIPHEEFGPITLRTHLMGSGTDYRHRETSLQASLHLHTMQWRGLSLSNTSARASLADGELRAQVRCDDPLMQWHLTTDIEHSPTNTKAHVDAQIDHLDLQALQIADTGIRPALRCRATLSIDSGAIYTLRARFTDMALSTTTQRLEPRPLELQAFLTPDTALLSIDSGDLTLMASAHTEGLPWEQDISFVPSKRLPTSYLTDLRATLSARNDNPVSNYLSLMGITFRSLHATMNVREGGISSHLALNGIAAKGFTTESLSLGARYDGDTLRAHLQSAMIAWSTPQMRLQGKASATLMSCGTFHPDSLKGLFMLSSVQYALPAYSLQLHTNDTLRLPLSHGVLTLSALPLYTTDRQPLMLDGHILLLGDPPAASLRLTARDVHLLQTQPTREALLYGRALVSGTVMLDGPFRALSITGNLRINSGSSLHYIYKDAILTANNQLDRVVTFTNFAADTTSLPKRRVATNNLTLDLTIAIDPSVQLEVSLGASRQNDVSLQGGGTLNLQYIPATGFRLSGRYTIEAGQLNMNIPLLHVSNMTIISGSMVTWSGSLQNPLFNIHAEERMRASVTLDGSPQSVLFVTGISLTDTMDKLNVQFTLSAPENAAMQNTLATLSPEERGKLSIALLTTGLYLGEGGTGNLMNTALMGILQSQIDNISRDAFRTVDVSVGIEPLPDGVSGVSTRTDYSFSIAKRLWNNRIRIIIGGSVTTTNERIEEDAVIDNISIEWRISPVGNQYLRFFYDKNYESILEGEIRETGIGYAYRRSF